MKPLARLLPVLALLPAPAAAHQGHPHPADPVPWTLEPAVLIPLGLALALYALGLGRVWTRAGIGRGIRGGEALMFALGWLALAGALVGPLHALGEVMFTAHMVEHEAIMALAAPLIVLARPGGAMLWALPRPWRRGLGGAARWRWLAALRRTLGNPPAATALHGVAIWAWHVPALFEAALVREWLHWLQHLSFLATALLFWWSLVRAPARDRAYGQAVGHLFATALHTGLLGALLVFAPRLLFPLQTEAAARWGLSPLEDQQLAGLVMWIPAGVIYAGAALVFAGLWIERSGRRAERGGDHALPAS